MSQNFDIISLCMSHINHTVCSSFGGGRELGTCLLAAMAEPLSTHCFCVVLEEEADDVENANNNPNPARSLT